ncbi:MAG: PfkB family carbohydrate kinase [Phycisphaerales bacterium]
MSLIVTGTIGIDTVYTPQGHREKVLGGSCTYFAAAASFHGPVRVVAAVGGDFPDAFRQTLGHFKGIDASGIEMRRGSKTFAWGGKYLANMNSRETLFTELGVLAEQPPEIPQAFRDSRTVFLANTHPAVQLRMLEALPKRGLTVADTMDLWINVARAELDLLLTRIDGLVLNYDEAELLTGKANTVAAARQVLKMGPKFVVVKKGEHGCILVHRDGMAALPAYPTETVIDPTGAGDTFAGGMMGYLANHKGDAHSVSSLREALAHGTVVASFNIESFSLERLTTLTRAELDARYREFAGMVRV